MYVCICVCVSLNELHSKVYYIKIQTKNKNKIARKNESNQIYRADNANIKEMSNIVLHCAVDTVIKTLY